MPTYAYKCECGHKDEKVLSLSDDPEKLKPVCIVCDSFMGRDFLAELPYFNNTVKECFYDNNLKRKLTLQEVKERERRGNYKTGEEIISDINAKQVEAERDFAKTIKLSDEDKYNVNKLYDKISESEIII